MRLWQHYEWVKHAIGVALLVSYWPSRRYMRRLTDENAVLRRVAILRAVEPESVDLVPLVDAVTDTVIALRDIAPQVTQVRTGSPVRLRAVP